MSDPFRRLVPGTRLPGINAEAWNAVMEAAEFHRTRGLDLGAGAPGGGGRQGTLVKVQNDSGADVDMGGVLGLGDALFDPADAQALSEFLRLVAVSGDVAGSSDLLVAVAAEPIPDGEVGRAWVAGACAARVRVTDSAHAYAKPDGTHTEYMASDASAGPARIIYVESGTPPYTGWAYVLLDRGGAAAASQGTFLGKLDGTLSQGGSQTVSVWAWNGSAYADTGANVTAHDWLLKSGATAIASGKKVVVEYFADSGRYHVIDWECP